MKKFLIVLLFLFIPLVSAAVTNDDAVIAGLLKQLETLRAMVASLQSQLNSLGAPASATATQTSTTVTTPTFTSTLFPGSSAVGTPVQVTGALATARNSYGGDPEYLDQFGTLVGPGIGQGQSQTCDQNLFAKGYASLVANGTRALGVSTSLSCANIGKNIMTSLNYSETDPATGAKVCYHVDEKGTFKMDCSIIQALTDKIPPPLPSGVTLTQIRNTSLNANTGGNTVDWSAYGAQCHHIDGDINGIYGTPNGILCGGPGAMQPTATQIVSSYASQPAGAATGAAVPTSGALAVARNAYSGDPEYLDQFGTKIGPGIGQGQSQTCDQNLFAKGYASLVANGTHADGVSTALSCANIGKNIMTSLNYSQTDSTGVKSCYHVDENGTFKIDCTLLQAITDKVPPTLPPGIALNQILNTSFNANTGGNTIDWSAYGAQCHHIDGDANGIYGTPNGIVCGGPGATQPTAQQIVTSYNNLPAISKIGVTVPLSPGSALYNAKQAYGGDPKYLDTLGTLVGPGIGQGQQATCDQNLFAKGYASLVANGTRALGVSTALSCANIGKNIMTSLNFSQTDSTGKRSCYHTDENGTFQIDCTILQGVLDVVPPPLPPGITLSQILNTSFNANTGGNTVDWSAYGAQCHHIDGDTNGIYGTPNGILCGGPGAMQPTGTQIANSFNSLPVASQLGATVDLRPGSAMYNARMAYGGDPKYLDQFGTQVGPGIGQGQNANCDQNLFAKGYGSLVANGTRALGVSTNLSCANIGKNLVTSMNFSQTDSSGKKICYHVDENGTFQIDCTVLQAITDIAPPPLPEGLSLNQILGTSLNANTASGVNWSAYGAQCHHIDGDINGIYGTPNGILCGGPGALQPTAAQITNSYYTQVPSSIPAGTKIQCTSNAMCGINTCVGATSTTAGSCVYQPAPVNSTPLPAPQTAEPTPSTPSPSTSPATTLPVGCTSTTTYSPVNGQRCMPITLPEGCTSTAGYSPTTGRICTGLGN